MPPKPSISRKPISIDNGKATMPPPPLPAKAILEPEINALSSCLKRAAVKTGQIFEFLADARRLGVTQQISEPPRTLTSALGHELERYDQLCDTMQSNLQRAISVLQRDLELEQQRIKAAESKPIFSRAPTLSPTSSLAALPDDVEDPSASNSQASAPAKSHPSTMKARRQSAISLSSLHRTQVPLKLDLSAASLRMPSEEPAFFSSGLASPVTLAPKSARPMEPNEMLMAVFGPSNAPEAVDIDLTVPDNNPGIIQLDPSLGSSVDKPIELDLDSMDIDMTNMVDLFGDESNEEPRNTNVEELFGKDPDTAGADDSQKNGLFDVLPSSEHPPSEDRFGHLNGGQGSQGNSFTSPIDGALPHVDSPDTLLANFTSNAGEPSNSVQGENFDLSNLDLSFFSSGQESDLMQMMDVANFLKMGVETSGINQTE